MSAHLTTHLGHLYAHLMKLLSKHVVLIDGSGVMALNRPEVITLSLVFSNG